MDPHFYLSIAVFAISFLAIIFDVFPKSLVAVTGALFMIVLGVLPFDEALAAVDLETIGLLMGMMLMVDIVEHSGVFSWLSVRLTKLTGGKPWFIFILFAFITALSSTFLNNVTVILIVLPIVLALTRGIGLDVKPFVVASIFFSIIGGALTLIGDPTNVIIGTSAGLGFNQFLTHLWIPISAVSAAVILVFLTVEWKTVRPISGNLRQLFLSHLLIEEIEYKFGRQELSKSFIAKVLLTLVAVIFGFVFGGYFDLNPTVVSLLGAMFLFFLTTQHSSIYKSLSKVEWPTLLFFAGLFVMVAGLEEVGALNMVGNVFVELTKDYSFLKMLLLLLWMSGIASMLIDNVPFVTMMVPIVMQIQGTLDPSLPLEQMWWAMALGACLGGCGSPIGSSVNIVALGLAEKSGLRISNGEYLRMALPLTFLMLSVCSLYFLLLLS
ncbi:MAG: SLC13 family permease [Candidatus Altimarinota bacterium]